MVYCALGQEIFLRPSSTKAIEFEMKNKCESCGRSKSRTFTVTVVILFFESNKMHLALEMNSTNLQ